MLGTICGTSSSSGGKVRTQLVKLQAETGSQIRHILRIPSTSNSRAPRHASILRLEALLSSGANAERWLFNRTPAHRSRLSGNYFRVLGVSSIAGRILCPRTTIAPQGAGGDGLKVLGMATIVGGRPLDAMDRTI